MKQDLLRVELCRCWRPLQLPLTVITVIFLLLLLLSMTITVIIVVIFFEMISKVCHCSGAASPSISQDRHLIAVSTSGR